MRKIFPLILCCLALMFPTAALSQTTVLESFPPYSVTMNFDTDTMTYTGMITPDSPKFLSEKIDEYTPKYLSLDSPGGYLDDMVTLFEITDNHPELIAKIAPRKSCMSLCAIFFSLFDNHEMGEGSSLMFHTPYPEQLPIHMSLGDVIGIAIAKNTEAFAYMLDEGYSYKLILSISVITNRDRYIMFTSDEQLREWRNIGFMEVPENATINVIDM